ncbi:hypothetical protein E2C01_087345 [Portunus trituberculatus]|uniref:Uncharacterized protein n=1 Tax=Portunus trituberculatus TaxID=210409 RepID=A0A5B7JC87_PORTR|nr:hypothetical protein [Portunus trituberculatus]
MTVFAAHRAPGSGRTLGTVSRTSVPEHSAATRSSNGSRDHDRPRASLNTQRWQKLCFTRQEQQPSEGSGATVKGGGHAPHACWASTDTRPGMGGAQPAAETACSRHDNAAPPHLTSGCRHSRPWMDLKPGSMGLPPTFKQLNPSSSPWANGGGLSKPSGLQPRRTTAT